MLSPQQKIINLIPQAIKKPSTNAISDFKNEELDIKQ